MLAKRSQCIARATRSSSFPSGRPPMINHDRYSPARGQGGEYVERRDHGTCGSDGFSRLQSSRYRKRETGRRHSPICSHHCLHAPGYKTTAGVMAGIFPVFSYDKRSSAISAIIIITALASSLGFITPGWAESTLNARSSPCCFSFFSSSVIFDLLCCEIVGRASRVTPGEVFHQLKTYITSPYSIPEALYD